MPGIQMKLSHTHFDGAFGKSPSTGSQMKMIEGISRLERSQSPLLSDPQPDEPDSRKKSLSI
jgi:hypothetical protein